MCTASVACSSASHGLTSMSPMISIFGPLMLLPMSASRSAVLPVAAASRSSAPGPELTFSFSRGIISTSPLSSCARENSCVLLWPPASVLLLSISAARKCSIGFLKQPLVFSAADDEAS